MKRLKNTYAIIMAGGIGSRFWPMSREQRPKQFLDILGTGSTLIQDAVKRYEDLVEPENIYIVTNEDYRELIKSQLPHITDNQILGEPFGKNTAACVAYAAHKVSELDEDAVLIIAPSDHLIVDQPRFIEQMHKAHRYAEENDALVTLGIKPHRPDTGYGYIQFGEQITDYDVHKVVTFTEKPPLELAQKFLDSGDFLWNSGMFVWSTKSILNALNTHLSELNLVFSQGRGAYNTPIEKEHIRKIYAQITSISIDNGVLEKADNVFVVPSEFGWSDLGTWKSVYDQLEESENKSINAVIDATNAKNNLVVTDTEKLVILQDLENYFIIDTKDALLICKSDKEQEVKKISSQVRKKYKGKFS
jgi:mannose-1-phosphate guanylyltransferase